MKKDRRDATQSNLKYRRVDLADIRRGRRGKHHDLVEGIFRELEGLPVGSALEIPLSDIGGIGLANLRSAVHRAMNTRGIDIETLADEKNFYVWRATRDDEKAG